MRSSTSDPSSATTARGKESDKPVTHTPGVILGLIEAPLGFVASKFRLLRGIPFRFSLNEHRPQHYISAITPKNKSNEFGDAYLIPAR